MGESVTIGLITGAVAFAVLMVLEKALHRWRHNADRSYRWGVWVFAVLAGLYAFVTSLGR
jgi:hypothetical protein